MQENRTLELLHRGERDCDAHVPLLLCAGLAAVGRWLVRLAPPEDLWAGLSEDACVGLLAGDATRHEARAVFQSGVEERWVSLDGCAGRPCPVTALGFVPPEQASGLDDIELVYADDHGIHSWHVNHKREREGGTGADGTRRLACSSSLWSAVTGERISRVERIAAQVVRSLGNGRPKSCGVLVFRFPDADDGDLPQVLAFDPVPLLALHRGELRPKVCPSGRVRWVDRVDDGTGPVFTVWPRSGWLVQVDPTRAARAWERLGDSLVRARIGTDALCDLALGRTTALLVRRHDEDRELLAANEAAAGVPRSRRRPARAGA